MKFTIEGFSQQAAHDLGLKATDLIILRWFTDFSATQKMKRWIVGGKIYYWVSYSAVCEALPILDVGEKHLRQTVFPRLVKNKVLTHKTFKKKDGKGGTFAAYGFGEKYCLLIENEQGVLEKRKGTAQEKDKGTAQECANKDSSIIVIPPLGVPYKAAPSNGFAGADATGNKNGFTDEPKGKTGQPETKSKSCGLKLQEFVDLTYPALYQQYMGHEHPHLKMGQRHHILKVLSDYMEEHQTDEIADLEAAAEEFFADGDCGDGNINLFANPSTISIRLVRQGFDDHIGDCDCLHY